MGVRRAKWEHRTAKRLEASKRKAASALLTPQQRLASLSARGYTATKERAKLITLIEEKRHNG